MLDDVTKDIEFIRKTVVNNISFSYIQKSEIHGFGLFADRKLEARTILCILDGQVMDWGQYDKIVDIVKLGKYQNYIFMEWNALDTSTLLVRAFRTKYSYINHSDNPNVKIYYNPLRIETLKTINKGEEILIDYTQEPLRQEYLDNKNKGFL